MLKLHKDERGNKLYPVCNWEENQHKLYNAHDRAWLAIYDAQEKNEDTDELFKNLERIESAMNAFERYVIEGLVWATWENRNLIMDLIWAYNARHN